MIGQVVFYNNVRGFGFLKPDSGEKDIFVRASAIEAAGLRPLTEGDRLSFDTEPGRGGKPQAANLKLID